MENSMTGLDKGLSISIFNSMVEYTDTLDKTFHALAHPIRREMRAHLTHKRFTVLEMAQLFDLSLNAVSKHLKVLEQAGLLHREIQGSACATVRHFRQQHLLFPR